jgi:hypothetical protein
MPFDIQTITYKGAQLLADATAADKLIIDGCDATAVALTEDQALAVTTRPASPLSNTTEVTQLGSTTEHVQSRVYFHAGVSAGGDANTLYLYGHTESAPTDLFVIFVCSSTDTFHLPEVGDVIDEWETDIDIVYTVSTDSVGFATQATYCSLSEFNILKNRTVTTHKEGDTTTGDDQTILGVKTFSNTVNVSNLVVPTRSRYVDLGTDSKAFNVLYAVQVTSEGFTLQNDVSDPNQGIVQFGIYGFYPSFAYDIGHANYKFQNAYFSGTVNAGALSVAGNILPTVTNADDVGSSTFQFKDAYFSGTVNAVGLSGTAPAKDTVNTGYIKLPVGGIVVAILDTNNVSNFSPTITGLFVGDEVTLTQGTYLVKTGSWSPNGTWSSTSMRFLPNGKYVLLTVPASPSSSTDYCPVLLQRVS